MIKYYLLLLLTSLFILSCSQTRKSTKILYFSKDSSAADTEKLASLSMKNGWDFIIKSDETYFQDDSLAQISTVFVAFSSLNQLGYQSVPALNRYLEAGGGIVVVADTLLNQKGWPWMQAWNEQPDGNEWTLGKGKLARIKNGYSSQTLEKYLITTIGKNQAPDYSQTKTLNVPESSRYTHTVLAEGLDEPMEMAILPDNNVLLVERKGGVKIYDHQTRQIKTIANFNVFSGIEDGLLGMATDPKFKDNHWVYFYYAAGGEVAVNRLSRFELLGDSLAQNSEKIILEIPTQRKYCCHSAGYIAFDAKGNLYLSTGDNTNAEETEGYTPVDERAGHELADDQATAANTNDLRGKILRITPQDDGTYTIPDGNLFPKNTPKTRPEIYTMGSRNPYRFTIDKKNNFLYWGEVGPDTKVMGEDGEMISYDEINQARKPGFYGWPYFLGNNQGFPKYDYATKTLGSKKDQANPINDSPNNTGLRELPPAQKAMIWYGKSNSKHFPLVGNGGASAMAGPVYYRDLFPNAPYKLSDYYEGKLFIYDWIRGWIMAVTLDEKGNYLRMEPFLEHLKFKAPVDLQFGDDGALYVLEYGTNWFSKNTDAKLIRIEYMEGNRNPVAEISMDKQYGGVPMTVQLSGNKSMDHDQKDQLTYSWAIDNQVLTGKNRKHTFNKAGTYEVTLSVTDDKGGVGTATNRVYVGNTPPVVNIKTTANRSFYWDHVVLDYAVNVRDQEDATINPGKVKVSFGYVPRGKDVAVILSSGQDVSNFKYIKGEQMVANLDCKSCHSINKASIGPTYMDISKRYAGKEGIVKRLSNKIIQGGSGVWAERSMTPHPAITMADASEMVNYILSLSEKGAKLPIKDALVLDEHIGKGIEGNYLLNASYTDQGANGIAALQSRDHIALRSPFVQAEDFDEGKVRIGTVTTLDFYSFITDIKHNGYIRFNQVDLTHVKKIRYRLQPQSGGNIELHAGKPDGPLLSTVTAPPANSNTAAWTELTASVKETKGVHDLYFVFTDPAGKQQNLFNVDWIYFSNRD